MNPSNFKPQNTPLYDSRKKIRMLWIVIIILLMIIVTVYKRPGDDGGVKIISHTVTGDLHTVTISYRDTVVYHDLPDSMYTKLIKHVKLIVDTTTD